MKMQRLLGASLAILFAIREASAQGVVSQMGGFLEQVHSVPGETAGAEPSPLSFFLQQEPPTYPVASSGAVVVPQPASFQTSVAPVLSAPPVLAKAFPKPKGLLTLRSMKVANSGAEGSKIYFGTGSQFSMGTDSAGNFIVQQASAGPSAPAPLLNLDSQGTLHLGSSHVQAQALDATNGISVRGVKQWQLVYSDDFSVEGVGWSRPEVTQCGGVSMLGGFCKLSRGEVNKTFTGLPPHKQLKVVASYHFIDRWVGETGYMKLDVGTGDCLVPVWSEQHTQDDAKNGISLCGNVATPEGKFATPVEVTLPHRKDSVQVTFGSTMADIDPCDESWGISGVEIYVRN